MKKSLLQILTCPVTLKGVALAKDRQLEELNAAIKAGKVTNRSGDTLSDPLAEALISDDGKFAYPVADGIPVLIESQAIEVGQWAENAG